MGIRPIKRVNVGEEVLKQLKASIIKGEWQQGEKLPSENELAELFGVSRITIRQALQKLGALGLLETRLGEGSFVRTIGIDDCMNPMVPQVYLGDQSIFQIFEFREMLDAEAARVAAERAEEEDISDLKEIFECMEHCQNSLDLRGFAEADLEFHLKVGEITKNPLVIKVNTILKEVFSESMLKVIERMGCESGVFYHKRILEAIECHDGQTAMELMREHIKKNPGYFKEQAEVLE